MLSSSSDRNNSSLKLKAAPPLLLPSPSSSSSSSSSSYTSSTLTNPCPSRLRSNNNITKTMEEVWKDINLASLNEQNTRQSMSTRRGSTFGGAIFQDFLSIDPSSNNTTIISAPSSSDNINNSKPRSLTPSPAPPTPLTALSLSCNHRPEFHFVDSSIRSSKDSHLLLLPHHHHHHDPNPNPVSKVSCFNTTTTATPFESLVCTSSLPCFENNRFAEPSDCNPGERRNKRMIKNRESAARSRARKQAKFASFFLAYTKELQLKVDHLLEENARLKRQQQQLCEAAASQQKKKKNTLYRTSTAPF
ncbi:hypothetical protein RIF29_37336 [Crotalaria pallida]|uniref:BZIP domain-containing protein n=1 Tax=Crotalaria pallida TaxID=3830 RepID=A0AAN9EEH5_CROPI